MSWYFTLLVCGLFLIGAEIFVPGGVLGVAGAAALIGAAVIGFMTFPLLLGWLSLFLILALAGAAVFVWMKYFPKSPIGRALSLNRELKTGEGTEPKWSVGMNGKTLSTLRPSGKAEIDGRRADVIAGNGTWIEQNASIEVIKVEGNRIYVKESNV